MSTESPKAPSAGERAVKDTARLFGAHLVVGFIAFFSSAWLNRKLDPEQLALWPLTLALSGLVASISSFGTGDSFVRIVPRLLARKRRRAAGAFLKTGLLINLGACALLSVAIYLLADPISHWGLVKAGTAPLVRLMAVATFFAAFRERLSWALNATQRFRQAALEVLVVEVPRPPLMVVLYMLAGVKGVIITLTLVPALSCVLQVIWLRPYLFRDWSLLAPRAVLRRSIAFYGVSLLGLVRSRLTYLLIPALSSGKALASYFVVDSLVTYLRVLNSRATAVVAPKLVEQEAQHPGVREALYARCMRYVFLGLLPGYVLLATLAGPATRLYGGGQYTDAAPLVVLLALEGLLEAIVLTQSIHIRAFSAPRHFLIRAALDAALNIGLFAAFVPRWGASGAGVALILRMLALVVQGDRVLRVSLRPRYDFAGLTTAITACLAPALIAFAFQAWWPDTWWVLFPAGVLAVVAFFLSLRHRLRDEDAVLLVRSFPRGLMGWPRVQATAQWMAGYVRRPTAALPADVVPPPAGAG